MPVTSETSAPYAPTKAIVGLIERHRQKGFTSLNEDVLQRSGIQESLISRTLQALATLDLIDEQGRPTPTLEGIRLASEQEYKQRLEDWLRAAYADALSFVDPAQGDEIKIRDAFRSYKPVGQQPRMVTLFMGLFSAAGIRPERKKPTSSPIKRVSKPNGQRLIAEAGTQENKLPPPPQHLLDHGKHAKSVVNQLLDKFPPFDPGWTDDLKAKWFDGYQRLLAMGEK